MSEPLLRTKLIVPPLRPQLVSRPHLDAKLQRARQVPLTLVSAPPGFGKTTATLAALHPLQIEGEIQLGWLSLAAEDDEPVRFWRYFVAALQQATGGAEKSPLGAEAAGALSVPQPAPAPALLAPLLNEIAGLPQQVLLVLDDTHLISHPEIYEGLAFLVEHAPPNLHLLLLTRADPPLPLHRLRARARLVEVRAHDLRFAEAEAAIFLQQVMALSLTDQQVARLNEQAEGWVSGLQLAALALQGHEGNVDEAESAALINRLSASNQYIAEYLAEEVLVRQPRHIQEFLLQTAILERLCGSLCDAVVQGEKSADLLEYLVRRNLFVTPTSGNGPDGPWYRYHQLFAELLRGHLHQQQPEQIPTLHRRAADWYEGRGDVEAAMAHALAGEAYAQVARLLEAYGPSLAMAGRALTLERWLRQIPEGELSALPRSNLAFSWALLLRGRYAEIEPYLRRAAAAIGDDGLLRGEWHALQASLAGSQGRAEDAVDHAQQALVEIDDEQTFVQGLARFALAGARRELGDIPAAIAAYERALPLCRAARLAVPELLARAHLGHLYLIQGKLQRAETVLRPALVAAQPAAAAARASWGLVLLEQYRLEEAGEQLHHALSLAERSGHNAATVHSQLALARLERTRGDLSTAQRILEDAATRMEEGVPGWIEPLLVAEQARLLLEQGALTPAAHLLAGSEPPAGAIRDVLVPVQARLLLAEKRPEAARALLDRLARRVEADDRQGRLVEALLLRALAATALEDEEAAEADVGRAVALAEPEGAVLAFLEGGPTIARLLARLESDYARRLLAAFPPDVHSAARSAKVGEAPTGLPEPLTERESEVLQWMARGLTYQQVADELVVSVNTVRHHVKGLYGKLQVNSRTQALQKARALDLLDQ